MENTMLNNTSSIEDLKNFAGEDVYNLVSNIMNCITYHFHDTSENASLKQRHAINDNLYLRDDASNLAAYLYFLSKKYPKNFIRIVKTIQLVAPFFGEFLLRPHIDNEDYIELEWFEKGEDIPFKIDVLSDGTLRFICLATLFLQPVELQPAIIIIDEPELGLHPYALSILAGLIKSASQDRQIIVSTQSVELLNHFSASDVIVAEKHDGCTKLKRLNENDLNIWLEDYSLGELWCKNILGGRPTK
jgi:predicted ATPase